MGSKGQVPPSPPSPQIGLLTGPQGQIGLAVVVPPIDIGPIVFDPLVVLRQIKQQCPDLFQQVACEIMLPPTKRLTDAAGNPLGGDCEGEDADKPGGAG